MRLPWLVLRSDFNPIAVGTRVQNDRPQIMGRLFVIAAYCTNTMHVVAVPSRLCNLAVGFESQKKHPANTER